MYTYSQQTCDTGPIENTLMASNELLSLALDHISVVEISIVLLSLIGMVIALWFLWKEGTKPKQDLARFVCDACGLDRACCTLKLGGKFNGSYVLCEGCSVRLTSPIRNIVINRLQFSILGSLGLAGR